MSIFAMAVFPVCVNSNSTSTASCRQFSTSKLGRVHPFQPTVYAVSNGERHGKAQSAGVTQLSNSSETVSPAALVRRRVTTFGRRGARGRREGLLRSLGRPRSGSNTQQPGSVSLPSRRRAVVLSTTPFVGLVTRRRAGGASSSGGGGSLQRGAVVKVRALDRTHGARKALVTLAAGLTSKKSGRNPQRGRAVQRFSTRLGRQLAVLAGQTSQNVASTSGSRSSRDERHRQALRSLPSTRTRSA